MTAPLRTTIFRVSAVLRRLLGEKRGNVLMIFGFAIIPLTFATGMGIDYGRAMRLQTKLNAAADAAALSAVTQQMMLESGDAGNTDAAAAAKNVFLSQITSLPGLNWSDANLKVTVTGNDSVTNTRTAVVSYNATSSNAFAGVLGMATLPIHGTSTATATAAPNIDFYVALDTSPSMALPTTTAGIGTDGLEVQLLLRLSFKQDREFCGRTVDAKGNDHRKLHVKSLRYQLYSHRPFHQKQPNGLQD